MSFRVQFTEIKPGGWLAEQDVAVQNLEDIPTYLDSRRVSAERPVTVIEYVGSDATGRIVPASEWDV